MKPLSDDTLRHLREIVELPDTAGTRYDVVEPIARGGMGVVFRARDRELDREVALKVLSVRDTGPDVRARMLTEARILARLEHPGIVPVHDVGVLADGRTYYAMKLIRGSRLDDYARAHPNLGERLRVFDRVCEAVAFAHSEGIVHRDLKPENVMVGAYGEVLVLDWGVAKLLRGEASGVADAGQAPDSSPTGAAHGAGVFVVARSTTGSGAVIGTPGYMAPEQARGESAQADPRSDVYALGAMLGFLTRDAGDRAALRRLRAIIDRATAEDPGSRYPNASSLADDVARFATGEAVSAYRERWPERARRVAARHRIAIGLVSAYLLMRVLLLLANRF